VQRISVGLRNAALCVGPPATADVPIHWPAIGNGAPMPELIGGQPRPGTRQAVMTCLVTQVDTMLGLYGIPGGPQAGDALQRRKLLLSHAGIYV
jgi:hypothetical protein